MNKDGTNQLFVKERSLLVRFLFLVILSLALIFSDIRFGYGERLRQTLLFFVSPIQYLVDLPLKTVHWLSDSISSHKALVDENVKLKYRETLLESKLQRMSELKNENNKLRTLLNYQVLETENDLIVSELLAVRTSPYRQLLILDKGTHDGVHPGLAVLDGKGVMGQIVESGPFTSTLLLVTDAKSAVPIKNARTGDRGILVGSYEHLSLQHMPKTLAVKEGDILLTSGLGRRFPEGYPVGVVSLVKRYENKPFLDIEVKPIAKLNRSRLMLIIKPGKGKHQLVKELASRYKEERAV